MDEDNGFAPMEVDEGPPLYMQEAPPAAPAPAPAALGFVDQAGGPEAPMLDHDHIGRRAASIRRDLDELRNQPRFEHDDERLRQGDDSSDDQILDGIWKIYRTNMEVGGAPYHYPSFTELQQYITTHRDNVAYALGITAGRLDRVPLNEAAKWILRKEDTVAPLRGETDSRRPELEQAAMMVLRNAGHNAEEPIDPIVRVKELGLLRPLNGGRRKGKKSTRRKGKKSTHRKGKKSTRAAKKTHRR